MLAAPLDGTCLIDYRHELDPAAAWQTDATETLTVGPTVWVDYDSPKNTQCFYRPILLNP